MADTGGISTGTQSFAGNKTFEGNVTVSGTLTTSATSQTTVAAGASGTAGTLRVFPTTASKGKLDLTCTDQTGNTTVTLNAAEMGQATAITIPDPGGATASVVLTEGAQTVNGVKTFGSAPILPAGGIKFDQSTFDAIVVAADQTGQNNTYTIPNIAASASFLMTEGAQTVNGVKSFTGACTTTGGVSGGTAKVIGGRSYAQTAAGSALTNSASETVLGTFTLPANTIGQGTMVRCRFQGIATATNSTDTLQIKLYLGATTLAGTACITTAAVDVANDNIFSGEFTWVGRAAAGASAAVVGVGSYSDPGAVGTAVKAAYMQSTNFATNAALLVEVSGKWSVASPSNSCRLDVLTVEVI